MNTVPHVPSRLLFCNARAVRGFSLIEIVISMTLIALFAGLVGPAIWQYLARGRETTTKITLKGMQEAIEVFKEDTGVYPNTISELYIRPSGDPVSKRWNGPYFGKGKEPLTEDPKDAFKHDFVYQLNPKGTRPPYILYSWGPHGEGSPQEEWIYA